MDPGERRSGWKYILRVPCCIDDGVAKIFQVCSCPDSTRSCLSSKKCQITQFTLFWIPDSYKLNSNWSVVATFWSLTYEQPNQEKHCLPLHGVGSLAKSITPQCKFLPVELTTKNSPYIQKQCLRYVACTTALFMLHAFSRSEFRNSCVLLSF